MHYLELKQRISAGLLSFPITHFDEQLAFNKQAYQEHIGWLSEYGAAALFAAGGTGELFSLTPDEVPEVVGAAKQAAGDTPIIAGCGFGTKVGINIAQAAQAKGADGLLLLPHYLIEATQEGLYQHFKAICKSVDIGVIIYNRANSITKPETIERLASECPNFIGFKDGTGDINLVREVCARMGERLAYIGGMPTHEMFAEAYDAIGVTTYSSAVFNFVPQMAQQFYAAMVNKDAETMNKILLDFFYPFAEIRDRGQGYPVSIIKAGLRVIGRDPGPVRPPLSDLNDHEHHLLKAIVSQYA